MRISATGGEVTAATTFDSSRQEAGHTRPTILPDGRHFLYYITSGQKETPGVLADDREWRGEAVPRCPDGCCRNCGDAFARRAVAGLRLGCAGQFEVYVQSFPFSVVAIWDIGISLNSSHR
jgi:hypothetical protein